MYICDYHELSRNILCGIQPYLYQALDISNVTAIYAICNKRAVSLNPKIRYCVTMHRRSSIEILRISTEITVPLIEVLVESNACTQLKDLFQNDFCPTAYFDMACMINTKQR